MKLRVRPLAAAATLVIVGAATATAFWPARTTRSTATSFYVSDPEHGLEGWREWPTAEVTSEPDEEGAYGDDPRRRMIHNWALFGRPGAEARAHLAREAELEARRLATRGAGFSVQKYSGDPVAEAITADFGSQWVNIGPKDAAFQWNGSTYFEVDAGRVTSLAIDPNDTTGRTVFASTAGGGLWKATEFAANDSQRPAWRSLTDHIGNQAVGAFAVAPSSPSTIYVGTGDPFDTEGGQLYKSTNGGADWTTLVDRLTATDPSNASVQRAVRTIRDLKVDPTNPGKVLVATDMGLFISLDGATFQYVDLPNSTPKLMEAAWSIAYLGPDRWAVSGVLACQAGRLPPSAGAGQNPGDIIPNVDPQVKEECVGGNPGDIWLTTTGGTSWTSLQTTSSLPQPDGGAGRITLAAGAPAGASTVLYAMVGNRGESGGSSGVGLWRSTNGGQSFQVATGTVGIGLSDCNDPNVGGLQSWYNHAIAVDPQNSSNVVIGGMLCGMRTRNGTAGSPTWEVVAHWLPSGGGAGVPGGSIDYVHADWHRALVVVVNGISRVIVGTDGGVSYSDNLFSASAVPEVTWHGANKDIATHLPYSVGSGDPATGNPYVVITGLQDNGTRVRDTSSADPGTYNQVIGGDGLGSAIVADRAGNQTLFASVNGKRQACTTNERGEGCNDRGGRFSAVGVELGTCANEADPFVIRYVPAQRDPRERIVLTANYRRMFRSDGADSPKFTAISPCLVSDERKDGHLIRDVSAAHHKDGIFGLALSGGRAAVTGNCPAGAKVEDCTWTVSGRLWTDLNGNGTREKEESVFFTNDVAFPPGPTGQPDGKVYVVVSGAPETEAETPVPAGLGHVFRTTDGGATFTNISGVAGQPGALPNVPAHSVIYDSFDLTNNTIYVGTDLGLYVTTDGGANWDRVGGASLPFVKVVDIFLSKSAGMMRIATYGRGLWELHPGAVSASVAGNGDYDRNGHIDFFDVAQLASRLGTTPAVNTQPVYERNLNVNNAGGVALLDDTDLTAVLGMVGEGQP